MTSLSQNVARRMRTPAGSLDGAESYAVLGGVNAGSFIRTFGDRVTAASSVELRGIAIGEG